MRIVFVGSKDLGCFCLKELINRRENIVGVIARHDDPAPGVWYGSVSKIAEEKDLRVFKPKDINDHGFAKEIKNLRPDMLFVVFYPQILKKHFIDIPPRGCINLHFAPLPKYRGCMPGAWAIIEGQKEFGVTMHYIDEGVDSGDIIAQEMFKIEEDDTGYSLYKRCESIGEKLFKRTFPLIKAQKAGRMSQDKSKVIYHKRGLPNQRYIDWGNSSRNIYNFIRALTFPVFPGPRTTLNGKEIIVKKCRILPEESRVSPGEVFRVLDNNQYVVATKDANIFIEDDGKINLKKGDKLGAR